MAASLTVPIACSEQETVISAPRCPTCDKVCDGYRLDPADRDDFATHRTVRLPLRARVTLQPCGHELYGRVDWILRRGRTGKLANVYLDAGRA